MKRLLLVLTAAVFFGSGGCLETDEQFTLKPDGSGSLTVELTLIPQAVQVLALAEDHPEITTDMPPLLTEENLRGLADEDGLSVTEAAVEELPDGGRKVSVRIEFEDVHKLARSRAARLPAFTVEATDDGNAAFRPTGPFLTMSGQMAPIGTDARMPFALMKLLARGARHRLEVSLPGKIVRTDGVRSGPSTVVWDWDVDKMKWEEVSDEDGNWLLPEAVFEAEQLEFPLPVKAVSRYTTAQEPVTVQAAPGQDQDFNIRPARIMVTSRVEFEGEKPGSKIQEIDLNLHVHYAQGIMPISYSNVSVQEAITDTGESIQPPQHAPTTAYEMPVHTWVMFGREERKFEVTLELQTPSAPCKKLQTVRGTLDVSYATECDEVEIKPIGAWKGKQIQAPGLEGREVHLVKLNGDGVKIKLDSETEKLFRQARFLDAAGNELDVYGRGSSGGGEYTVHSYHNLSVPEDGAMVLEFYKELKKKRVPFEIKDIPLP